MAIHRCQWWTLRISWGFSTSAAVPLVSEERKSRGNKLRQEEETFEETFEEFWRFLWLCAFLVHYSSNCQCKLLKCQEDMIGAGFGTLFAPTEVGPWASKSILTHKTSRPWMFEWWEKGFSVSCRPDISLGKPHADGACTLFNACRLVQGITSMLEDRCRGRFHPCLSLLVRLFEGTLPTPPDPRTMQLLGFVNGFARTLTPKTTPSWLYGLTVWWSLHPRGLGSRLSFGCHDDVTSNVGSPSTRHLSQSCNHSVTMTFSRTRRGKASDGISHQQSPTFINFLPFSVLRFSLCLERRCRPSICH